MIVLFRIMDLEIHKRHKIYFVTGNENKFKETKSIIENDTLELIQLNIDLPEYQGDPKYIALKKCADAQKILSDMNECKYPLIIEDTSLCFNGMNGMPGPYVKWFLSAIGIDGLVKMLNGFDDRSAVAKCYISYVENEKSYPVIFEGNINGLIVHQKGNTKFGWDPIFQPLDSDGGNGQTFAEMNNDFKNTISHRYRALCCLMKYLSI